MFYGSQTWNPVLIIAQIFAIQSLFYLTFGLALWVLVGPYTSGKLTLVHFFGTEHINFRSFLGWMEILATVGNAIPTSIIILVLVERAKKCLDFAATVFILHLGVACVIAGIPRTAAWAYTHMHQGSQKPPVLVAHMTADQHKGRRHSNLDLWLANIVAFIITAIASEWLCLRREMKDIPIGGAPRKKFSGALDGSELVSLGSGGNTLSKATSSLGSRQSPTESSLLGRIKATIGSSRLKAPNRDTVRLAEEV